MTKFHYNPSPPMKEQICGKVEVPRSCAGESPGYRKIKYQNNSPNVKLSPVGNSFQVKKTKPLPSAECGIGGQSFGKTEP